MDKKETRPKWAGTLQTQISGLRGDVEKLRTEIQGKLEELEARFGSSIQSLENEMRELTRPNPDIWYWESLSIVAGSAFVACLIASVGTQRLDRMTWGFFIMLFGNIFVIARMFIGRLVQTRRGYTIGLLSLGVAITIAGIWAINQGYLEFISGIKV